MKTNYINRKIQLVLTCMFVYVSISLTGQSISSEVISNGGEIFENSAVGTLSWTLGEIATETLTSSDITLTQGFQQGNLSIVSTQENLVTEIKLYPNPTLNILSLETAQLNEELTVDILTLNGQIINTQKLSDRKTDFDLSLFAPATYLVRIRNKNNTKSNSYTIVKH